MHRSDLLRLMNGSISQRRLAGFRKAIADRCDKATLFFIALQLLLAILCTAALARDKPSVMLAGVYHEAIDLRNYWVSEKLDGVRARWDGQRLISRGGLIFQTPTWFTKDFPTAPLDGELWIARGQYEQTSSIVRRIRPHDGWRKIRFMVFDMPAHGGTFDERVATMRALSASAIAHLDVVEQFRVESHSELQQLVKAMTRDSAEGLMLHRGGARYGAGRSQDLLKLKLFDDTEATVIGYRPGKGKYQGMTGSLRVRNDNGKEFHVGSGLNDEQRRHPPALGARITLRHQGLAGNGIPRFPVFLRIRDEEPSQ